MNIAKPVGFYILGQAFAITVAKNNSFPELSSEGRSRIFTFPLSRFPHENIFADRAARWINIGAVLMLLYILITTVTKNVPIAYSELLYSYDIWIFFVLFLEVFFQDLYCFKRTTGFERFVHGLFAGLAIFVAPILFVLLLFSFMV